MVCEIFFLLRIPRHSGKVVEKKKKLEKTQWNKKDQIDETCVSTCKIPDKRDRPKRIKVITRAMKIMNYKFNKNETIKKNE